MATHEDLHPDRPDPIRPVEPPRAAPYFVGSALIAALTAFFFWGLADVEEYGGVHLEDVPLSFWVVWVVILLVCVALVVRGVRVLRTGTTAP